MSKESVLLRALGIACGRADLGIMGKLARYLAVSTQD